MATSDSTSYYPHRAICEFYGHEFEFIYLGTNVEINLLPRPIPISVQNLAYCINLARNASQPFMETCAALDVLNSSFQTRDPNQLMTIYRAAMTALTQPYWDIDALLPNATQRLRALAEKIKSNSSLQIGYVYLLKFKPGVYKIGMSIHPERRASDLSTASPEHLTLECSIHSDDMMWLENELHTRFGHKRIRREWFKLSTADVQFFHALADGKSFEEAEKLAYNPAINLPLFSQE